MRRFVCSIVAVVLVSVVRQAAAFTFTLAPVTTTAPNFPGTIFIPGTVTVAAGETFYSPTMMSTVHLPFLSNFSAGFNGSGQGFDPSFLAWSGVGTYSGPVFNHLISLNNTGYASGMPVGLYGFNPLGPGGQASLVLNYIDAQGITRSAAAPYAINVVVPDPTGGPALLGIAGVFAVARRRRR